MKTARVRMQGQERYNTKTYDFLLSLDTVKEGSLVVCDTVHGYALATVLEVVEQAFPSATKWIVDCVDTKDFEEKKERMKEMEELKKQMEKKRKKYETERIYKIIAEEDPEMREAYNRYISLKKMLQV